MSTLADTAPTGVDIALRDGSTVHVRPVSAEDASALETFLSALSVDSVYLRFFSVGINLEHVARRAAELRPPERTGLVVLAGDPAALSALAAAHPQVAELDCNPVLVGEHGAVVVDARVGVTAPPPPRLWPSLDR